jgi:hypothetical protein
MVLLNSWKKGRKRLTKDIKNERNEKNERMKE